MKRKFSILLLFVCLMMFAMLIMKSFAQDTTMTTTLSPDGNITIISEITQTTDAMGWVLLFAGWLMYWLKKLDDKRAEMKSKGVKDIRVWASGFIADNLFEVPISLVACFVLIIFAPSIPTDLIDLHGRISIFMVGFASSSILNGLITKSKAVK